MLYSVALSLIIHLTLGTPDKRYHLDYLPRAAQQNKLEKPLRLGSSVRSNILYNAGCPNESRKQGDLLGTQSPEKLRKKNNQV